MNNQSYAVLVESDCGMDEFNNPKGKRMVFETIGDGLEKNNAIKQAETLKASGRFGQVKVVRLEVCNFLIEGEI